MHPPSWTPIRPLRFSGLQAQHADAENAPRPATSRRIRAARASAEPWNGSERRKGRHRGSLIRILDEPMPTVAVVCGSRSDLSTLKGCFDVLDSYGIAWEASVISAHRQPDALHAYVAEAEAAGVRLFIGAAGLAAHLPGVLASLTAKPVIGIPLDGGALGGADALYAVVQMPPGVPVATVAIGSAGAKNAGHLAARILALADEVVAANVAAFREDQASRAELRIDPRA
jgi:5-(carboxyamino)imidazole ribonucleotide mutase